MKRLGVFAGVLMFGLAGTCWGYLLMVISGEDLERVAIDYTRAHPRDAEGYFSLGRVYMTRWTIGDAKQVEVASSGGQNQPAKFPPWATVMLRRGLDENANALQAGRRLASQPAGAEIKPQEAAFVAKAVQAYRRALELDNENARYHLALACALEEMGTVAQRLPASANLRTGELKGLDDAERPSCAAAIAALGDADQAVRDRASKTLLEMMPRVAGELAACRSQDPEVIARISGVMKTYWWQQAIGEYRKAYALTFERDLASKTIDDMEDGAISARAAERMLVLFAEFPEAAAREEVRSIEVSLAEMKAKPRLGRVFR